MSTLATVCVVLWFALGYIGARLVARDVLPRQADEDERETIARIGGTVCLIIIGPFALVMWCARASLWPR